MWVQTVPKYNRKGRRKSGAARQPTDTELQLAGLMYIAYLLANNEVQCFYARCLITCHSLIRQAVCYHKPGTVVYRVCVVVRPDHRMMQSRNGYSLYMSALFAGLMQNFRDVNLEGL